MISSLGLIWGLGITAGSSAIAFGLLIWKFDPLATGQVGLILFMISLGIFLATSLFFALQAALSRNWADTTHLLRSLRQSTLLALGVIMMLLLAYWGWLAWWSAILSVVILFGVELFFRLKVE